jgi:hypothetical protein
MNEAARHATHILVAAAILVAPAAAYASDDDAEASRVRSDSEPIKALVARAREGSPTFRRIVDEIEASDGVVYITNSTCLDGQRACFIGVTAAGGRRNLWVHVDVNRHDDEWDVARSLAHELRHVVEVLAVPGITSTAAMHLFYQRIGYQGGKRSYETQAAVDAGEAVRAELRAYARRAKSK